MIMQALRRRSSRDGVRGASRLVLGGLRRCRPPTVQDLLLFVGRNEIEHARQLQMARVDPLTMSGIGRAPPPARRQQLRFSPRNSPSPAPVAQGIERRFPKPQVGRSNRPGGADRVRSCRSDRCHARDQSCRTSIWCRAVVGMPVGTREPTLAVLGIGQIQTTAATSSISSSFRH
jgi:hypothetical protein